MSIEMSNPWWLLLIPVVAAGLVFSGRFFRMTNRGKKIKYLVMRGVIALLLILTLCGLSFKITSKRVTTVFLVDMSDSNEKNLEGMQTYIHDQIKAMPKKNQAGVVVFGDNVLVDQFVTEKKLFDEVTSEPVSTATNLEKAISTALTIFPDDTAKRLVILSDGLENAGSVEKMAGTVLAQNVEIKCVKLEQTVGEEVYVSNLELPEYVHIGDTFNVKVSIESNIATDAVVSLYSGRTLKGQSTVKLETGSNHFVFQDVGGSNGTQDYHVMVEPVNDTVSMNNEYVAFTQVESEPKVLLVEGEPGEGTPLAGVFDACGVKYDVVSPVGVPEDMSALINYKAVVLVNVHANDLREGFLNNLESYVRDYAGGLICTGGDNSFAMGGYQNTPLETVLPVNMFLEGVNQVPDMAVVMVIDHSGSMTTLADGGVGTCLDLAKEAACAGVDTLRPNDAVGVLAFDDTYDWAVPLQNANNPDEIKNNIATIRDGGGTSIFPALDEAASVLNNSDAQIKHIILLTDGQDYYNEYDKVIDKINNGGISLSTVAVGPESDQQMLQKLANSCNGRYYYTDVNSGIPKIFAQEIILSGKSYLINREFTPIITGRSEIINDIAGDGLPSLLGYIGSSSKPQATEVLKSDEGDPILTTWQFGLGRAVAWNSDASNEWSANWATWEQYSQFWDNMINYVVSDTNLEGDSLEVVQEGQGSLITYTTDEYNENTSVVAVCTDAEGNTKEITLDPVAPGKFEATMPMDKLGVYTVALQNRQGEEVKRNMISAAAMQYSPEYRYDQVSTGLDNFMSKVNGAFITYDDNVFASELEMVRARTNMTVPLLVAALILFLLDIVVRRMNLDYFEWFKRPFGRRKPVKQATVAEGEQTDANAKPLKGRKAKRAAKKEAKAAAKAGNVSPNMGANAQAAGRGTVTGKAAGTPNPSGSSEANSANAEPVNDWVAANEKRKRQEAIRENRRRNKIKQRTKEQQESLNMDELLKKKNDRQW